MTDGPIGPGSTVEYTVKELLDEQTGILRDIDKKVDQKADKSDLVVVVGSIAALDVRVDVLEEHRTVLESSIQWRHRAWAVAGSLAVVATPITAALIASHH